MGPEFRDLILTAGLSIREARDLCGVTDRHFRRYLADTISPPSTVLRLLEARAGALGWISADWDGWTLNPRNGHLTSPHGEFWTAADLRGLWWHHQQLANIRAELRAEVRRLEAQTAALRARIAGTEGPRAHPKSDGNVPLGAATEKQALSQF